MDLEINKIKTPLCVLELCVLELCVSEPSVLNPNVSKPCESHTCDIGSQVKSGSQLNGLRPACSVNSTGYPFRILRVIVGVLALCLFGPLSCNSIGLRFSDSNNSSGSKQTSSEAPISKDSGKTEQSKPADSLNSSHKMGLNTPSTARQHADFSRDIVRKVSSGHKSQIFGLFPFKAAYQDGFSFDLASVDKDGTVLLWDFRKGKSTAYEIFKLKRGFTSVAFNSGKLRMAVAYPGLVEIISLKNGMIEFQINRIKSRISSLDFNSNGDSLLTGGADGIIHNWRFEFEKSATTPSELEKSLQRYIGHSSVVNHVLYHPFGRVFFSTDWFGVLSAWLTYESDAYGGEYDKNALQGQIFTHESDRVKASRADADIIESIEISADGERLFLASEKGKLQVWQVRGFKLIAEIEGHKGVIYSLSVNTNGEVFSSIGRDGYMRVWQLVEQSTDVRGVKSYTIEKRDEKQDKNIRILRFIDSNRIVAGDSSGKLFEIMLPTYPRQIGDQ